MDKFGLTAMIFLNKTKYLENIITINANKTLLNDESLENLFRSSLKNLEEMNIKHTPLITI